MNRNIKIFIISLFLFFVFNFNRNQLYAQVEFGNPGTGGGGCVGCIGVGGPGQPPVNSVNYNNPPTNLNAQTPGGTPGEYDPNTGEFRPLIELGGTITTQGTATQSQQAGGIPAAPPPNLPQVTPTSVPPPSPTPTSAPQQTVYGAVFDDINQNCVKDPGEKLLNDWPMHRGFSSQVTENGSSLPSACWSSNNDITHTISDDVNYSMTYDPSNILSCAGGNGTPFYITTMAPDSVWQPSSVACGVFGYASAVETWSHAVQDYSGFQNNRLRVDFPMYKGGPDLFTEAVGIEGGTGGNGADRIVTAHVGQSVTLSGMITNIGKQRANASTARFCIDNTSCLTSANGKIAELSTPTLDVAPPWGGSGQYYEQTTTNWVVNASVGTHTIWLCADVFNTSGEGPNDKLNNCGTHSITVVADGNTCNSACSSNADCSQAGGGCNLCLPGTSGAKTCQPPPACNSACTSNADCSQASNGCNVCIPGAAGSTCQQPPVCNSACSSNADCANIPGGCNACLPNGVGGTTCQKPPACNVSCSKDADCAGAKDGCTACVTGSNGSKSCQPPVACNSTCTKDSDCATGDALKNGCTACNTNANGTKSCQPPVACNSTCTKDSDCATGDALKNGCTACNTNANGSKSCQPPVACNSTCTKNSDCATGDALKNGCTACNTNANGTKSCQPPVACNSTCTKDSDCAAGDALKNGCTACNTSANGTKSCQPPVACNSACVKDADCNSGTAVKDGCTSCLPNGSGGTSCQKNVACNSACTKDSDCNTGDALKNGCTTCINSSCQTFSPDMCSCDGIESTPIASGNNVTVTNFEKVVGGDINKAKVKEMTFYLTEGDKILAKSQPIAAAIDSSSAEKARFKSSWTVQIPANAKPNTDYRIFAQVNCVKKDALAYTPAPSRVVLGEQAPQNQNIFARFFGFITGIFTGRNVTPQTGVTPTATATPTQTADNPQLQIGTFSPSTSVEKSCRFIKFKFK